MMIIFNRGYNIQIIQHNISNNYGHSFSIYIYFFIFKHDFILFYHINTFVEEDK